MVAESGAWRFDASLTHIPLAKWRSAAPDGIDDAIERLFEGQVVNFSEQRSALHPSLRAPVQTLSAPARAAREQSLALADVLHRGKTPVRTLLHVGIGGSDLGPRLVADALDAGDAAVEVRWLATLDDRALGRMLAELDPSTTGLFIASKSFGTRESLLQASVIRDWLGADRAERVWAATARPDLAIAWGVPEEQVLPVDEAVGGRFSLWSAVGTSAAARIGPARFQALLDGAAAADEDFRRDPSGSLAGRLALVIDQLAGTHGFPTFGVVSYAPALRRLADYLQQLLMESLGKHVTPDGRSIEGAGAPLVFGGAGTDLQHAIYQAVHQGPARHPMLLVGELPQAEDRHGFQVEQLANLLGQARCLALGRDDADPGKALPGGNPVMTLLTRRLDPAALGQLLAHWEHAVYLLGLRWNLNPFDQWGVEEGKRQAEALRQFLTAGTGLEDPALEQLLAWIRAADN